MTKYTSMCRTLKKRRLGFIEDWEEYYPFFEDRLGIQIKSYLGIRISPRGKKL